MAKSEEGMREELGWWLGYGERWRADVERAMRAQRAAMHVAIWGPPRSGVAELAAWMREATEPAPARLIVAAEGASAAAFVRAAATVDAIAVVRVPAMAERRDEIDRIVGAAFARRGAAAADAADAGVVAALSRHAWQGIEDVELIVRAVIALRGGQSLRRAAAGLGVKKSTLDDALVKIGVRPRRST